MVVIRVVIMILRMLDARVRALVKAHVHALITRINPMTVRIHAMAVQVHALAACVHALATCVHAPVIACRDDV